MNENIKHTNTTTHKNTAIETGAALASGGTFGLVGAIIGSKIGSFAGTKRHNIPSKIGMWSGGVLFGVLSLYASFKNRASRAEQLESLQEENAALKARLLFDKNVAMSADEHGNIMDGTMPDQLADSRQTAQSSQPHTVVKDIKHGPALELSSTQTQR